MVLNLQNDRYTPITNGMINANANAQRVGKTKIGKYRFNVFCINSLLSRNRGSGEDSTAPHFHLFILLPSKLLFQLPIFLLQGS